MVPIPVSVDEKILASQPTVDVTKSETPPILVQGNASPTPAEDSVIVTPEEPHSTLSAKRDSTLDNTIGSRKKNKLSKVIDASALHVSELKLDKDIELRLIEAGYTTIQDLVPNRLKSDLTSNPILNRKSRCEIEARLKQRKISLK